MLPLVASTPAKASPAGITGPHDPKYAFFQSESGQLKSAALDLIPSVVSDVLDSIGWQASEVGVGCGHQVTAELVREIRDLCGVLPGREIVTVTDCGNTAAASVPLCLSRAYDEGKLTPGVKILLIGGAAGFSVGVIPIVW